MSNMMENCPYKEPCCFRAGGGCRILTDTTFKDGKCHFRKRRPDGVNLYDAEKDPTLEADDLISMALERIRFKFRANYALFGSYDFTDQLRPELERLIREEVSRIRAEVKR